MPSSRPIVVVEDDPFTRLVQIVLDPRTSTERFSAFADFMAHDQPDFVGWCECVRARAPNLYPADVRLVSSQEELRAHMADACALVVESLNVGREDIAAARNLKAVQKFGTILRNIDTAACAERGVKVLSLRRRVNMSCAEHAFGLMLMLAKRTHQLFLPSVRPPAHAQCELGKNPRSPGTQRQHHRHHRAWRNRPRNRIACCRFRDAQSLLSAHAALRRRRARIAGSVRAARRITRRQRLDHSAIAL